MFNVLLGIALAVEISFFILEGRLKQSLEEDSDFLSSLEKNKINNQREEKTVNIIAVKTLIIFFLKALGFVSSICVGIMSLPILSTLAFVTYILVSFAIPFTTNSKIILKVTKSIKIGILLFIFFSV